MASVHTQFGLEDDGSGFPLMSNQRDMSDPLDGGFGQPCGMNYQRAASHVHKEAAPAGLSQFHLVNTSIADKADLQQTKAFAFDWGKESDHFTNHFAFEGKEHKESDDIKHVNMRDFFSKSPKKEAFGNLSGKKKRRLSALFLSPSFFEDHAKTTAPRRSSITSVASFASVPTISPPKKSDLDDASVISEVGDGGDAGIDSMEISVPLVVEEPVPGPPSEDVRAIMQAFTASMMKSQKSQQAIHDWDKKMGLKRSHSKTMRLSMRSRKKLKTMIKKDINAIA